MAVRTAAPARFEPMTRTEEGADGDESIVELWARADFGDAAQVRQKFGELLEHTWRKSNDVAQIVFIGESFARAARAGEAVAASDFLERLHHRRDSPADREHIVTGLVSIGAALLDHDLRVEAIDVYSTVESLADDDDRPALRQSLAHALSEKGFALKEHAWATGDEELMERALSSFSELEHRFGGAPGTPFEEVVANGTYNKAGVLAALGRIEEATSCFADVEARYGSSDDPALRDVASWAAIRKRMMVAIPDAPPYIEPLADLDDGQTKTRHEAAVESHWQASQILMQHRVKALPFALFLRGFESEGLAILTGDRWPSETGLEPHVIRAVSLHPSRLERALAEAAEGSVVAVGNPDSLHESAWLVPRLFLPNEGWRELVESLIETAHFVVIRVEAMTAGVRWELECLERRGRARSTLVVLMGTDEETANDRLLLEGLRRFADRERGTPPATKEAIERLGFTRVLNEDEIPAAGLAAAPLFRDLLEDMKATANLDPRARLEHLAAGRRDEREAGQ